MTKSECFKICKGKWLLLAEDNETGYDRCLLLRTNNNGTMRTRRIQDIEECNENSKSISE